MLPGDHAWRDLQEAELAGLNLDGSDFTGADLRGADLWGTFLRGCRLCFANLEGTDIGLADLTGADLTGAWLGDTMLGVATGVQTVGAFTGGKVHWDALYQVVRGLYVEGWTAEQALEAGLAFEAANPQELLAEVLLRQGAVQQAKVLLVRAFEAEQNPFAARQLSRLLPPDEAVEVLSKARGDHPGVAGDLGYLLTRMGRKDEAGPHLYKALRAGVPDAGPYQAAAFIDLAHGRRQDAHLWLEKAVARSPNMPEIRLAMAALLALGEGEERGPALTHLDVVVRSRRASPETWVGACELFCRLGCPEIGLDLLERLPARISPMLQDRARRSRIEALSMLGRSREAKELLRDADEPAMRADVSWLGGDVAGARAWLRECPPSRAVAERLVRQGDDHGALEVLELLERRSGGAPDVLRDMVVLARRCAPERVDELVARLQEKAGGSELLGAMRRAEQREADRVAYAISCIEQRWAAAWADLPPTLRPAAVPQPVWPGAFAVVAQDQDGPRVLLGGATGQPTPGWDPIGTAGAFRWYRPNPPGAITADADQASLLDAIGGFEPQGEHPMCALGLCGDLQQVVEGVEDTGFRRIIPSLVNALEARGVLDDRMVRAMPKGPVFETYGPELGLCVDGRPTPLPELPQVHVGPKAWLDACWYVSTALDLGVLHLHGRVRFEHPLPQSSPAFRGLVIYALLRKILGSLRFVVPIRTSVAWAVVDEVLRGVHLPEP